jgi:hypothetical protein
MKSLPAAAMICMFWLMYGSIARYQTGRKFPATSSGTQEVRWGLAPAISHPSTALDETDSFAVWSVAGAAPERGSARAQSTREIAIRQISRTMIGSSRIASQLQ